MTLAGLRSLDEAFFPAAFFSMERFVPFSGFPELFFELFFEESAGDSFCLRDAFEPSSPVSSSEEPSFFDERLFSGEASFFDASSLDEPFAAFFFDARFLPFFRFAGASSGSPSPGSFAAAASTSS